MPGLDCPEVGRESEDRGPEDKGYEGSDRQEVKDQPVVDLLEQGGTRQPAESARGENSHLQILCQEAGSEPYNSTLTPLTGSHQTGTQA